MNVRLSIAFSLATLAACASNSDATDGADDTSTTNSTTSSTMSPTDGAAGGLGAACDHAGDLGFANGPLLTSDPLCGDGRCAFPDMVPIPPIACVDDASCNVADLEHMRFVCNDGTCIVNDAYKLQRSMCATSCSSDDDCAAADPDSACEFGFQCVIVSPSCCTPLCLCSDDFSLGQVDFATAECGKQAEPSCAP